MNQHRKALQISILSCDNACIPALIQLIKNCKCDILTLDFVRTYRALHMQIEGTFVGINHFQQLAGEKFNDQHMTLTEIQLKKDSPHLAYTLSGKLFSRSDGFDELLLWTEQIQATVISMQLQNMEEAGYHFQIDILVGPEIGIRQMKEDFYELCDNFDMEGYIDNTD